MDYRNPILPGFHPDPTVCRAGEDYYLATSSFEYFPGVPLYRSENLVDWTPVGHCLTRDDQLPIAEVASSEGVFAPTLRERDGTFFLVTTLVGAGGHLVVTVDDPLGEWSDPVWIDAPGYDPDLFWDDGTTYLTYAADDAIHQTTVDLDSGETGASHTIWHGLEGAYTEAPHLYAVDGTYYLLAAEGGTHAEHAVSVARSDDPTGPFESHPDNPIFSHRSRVMHPISATGHGDVVRAHDGSWWMTFLAIRQRGEHVPYHTLGRETFLAPVAWADGWPVVNGGDPVDLAMSVADTSLRSAIDRSDAASADLDPAGATVNANGARAWTRTTDPFSGDALGHEWNYRRTPHRDRYRLRGGTLVLDGGPATLGDARPTFVGRRQQHHAFRATATLAFDPSDDEEAGLSAFANEDHHYDVAVVARDGERRVVARRRVDGLADVVGETSVPDGPVTLAVVGTDETYRLLAGPTDGDLGGPADNGLAELGAGDARYLSTEVATGFTGVYLGLYATGNGVASETAARFTDFAYGPTAED